MDDNDKLFTRQMCINQLIRPKTFVPEYIRPEGTGDCTTCKPCLKNLQCNGYIAVSLVPCGPPRKEEKNNDNNGQQNI